MFIFVNLFYYFIGSFGKYYFCQLILLNNLFLLLFMSFIIFFGTIYRLYYIILINF